MKTILILIISIIMVESLFAQWILQQSNVTSPLEDIEFINVNTGWACGYSGVILKTTNGGVNWSTQITNVPNKPLLGIHPVNENVVYSVGWFSTILKTTNGGNNWIALENGIVGDGNYFSVFFLNETTGWIGENNNSQGDVKKTTDGGVTFTSSSTFGWPYDIYFKDSLNGVGVDGGATIHRTTNGGSNWISFSIAGTGDFYRVSFINNFTGYTVANGSNKVYKTTDFGLKWILSGIVKGVVESMYCIRFKSDSIGWVGGTSYLWKSTNGGVYWRRENLSAGYFISISALNDSIVWACGNPGRIWHTTNGGQPFVGIENISNQIPERFELYQNYPNPFNSETNIEFKIKLKSNYKLEIINSLGKVVEILINEELNPGSYKFNFNANDIPSGLYFYRLSSEYLTETKKFILIK